MNSTFSRSHRKLEKYQIGILYVAGIVAVASAVGCDIRFIGTPGSGVFETQDRQVNAFTKIDVDGVGTVNVSFGEEPSLKVTCDDNLIDLVATEVIDGALRISVRENISPTTLTFDVVTPSLSEVDIDGAASVNVRGAKETSLKFSIDGASNISAEGTVDQLEISVSGAAKIDADELQSKDAIVEISGAGKAEIYATESLDATISGAGSVNCLGAPKNVKQKVDGAGRIKVGD